MMKSVIAAAALALLSFSAEAKTAKKHKSTAHTCMKDGAEAKTAEGKSIRREKTCKKNGGTWEMADKGATGSKDSAKPADAAPAGAMGATGAK